MEESQYEWEAIKGMTSDMLVNREIAILEKEVRRITKRLDYLYICKNCINKKNNAEMDIEDIGAK